MSLATSDYAAIKSELTNDPTHLSLTVLSSDDEANANALNLVRDTIHVKKRGVNTADIVNAIDPIEHQSLSDQQARWLDLVTSLGQIDPFSDTNITDGLSDLFGGGTTSGPAIASTFLRSGSRLEQLYQAGAISSPSDLTPSDVANARSS